MCCCWFVITSSTRDRAPERTLEVVEVEAPGEFAGILYPADNPTTVDGLALGRRLFYDPILSVDSTISCASCHLPERAFADGQRFSRGVGGILGNRNTPALVNVGFNRSSLFLDGRADDLEKQALHPISAAHEMGGSWPEVLDKLRTHTVYGPALYRAFALDNVDQIDSVHVGRALAQFQRSLISANSKYDRVKRGKATYTPAEELGHAIFFDLADDPADGYAGVPVGECAHCHAPPHFTNNRFFNNGLDEAPDLSFSDLGRGAVTGNRYDNGLFRTPSLRNVELTAPYMHDGRLRTLAEVIDHYNSGGHYAPNRSPNVRPLGLDARQKEALVAFLRTLTDSSFVHHPDYASPF